MRQFEYPMLFVQLSVRPDDPSTLGPECGLDLVEPSPSLANANATPVELGPLLVDVGQHLVKFGPFAALNLVEQWPGWSNYGRHRGQ